MVDKCDICGFHHGPNDRYCGRCNVDLREEKQPGEQKPNPEKNWSFDDCDMPASKKKKPDDEKVIHWCMIRAVCNSSDISFPTFLVVVLMLAKGEKVLGFCNCASCNRGYRELQAWIINGTERKNLTAQSREIVIKSSYDKIDGMTYDISKLLGKYQEINANETSIERNDLPLKKTPGGKITIEIDSEVLENAVFNVLKTERGRAIIQSVPRKYTKRKGGPV
jgi:hypothetical protein